MNGELQSGEQGDEQAGCRLFGAPQTPCQLGCENGVMTRRALGRTAQLWQVDGKPVLQRDGDTPRDGFIVIVRDGAC